MKTLSKLLLALSLCYYGNLIYAQTNPIPPIGSCPYYPPDQSYHRICFDDAVKLINNFLNLKNSSGTYPLRDKAINISIGGYIEKMDIKIGEPAYRFYPCYDPVTAAPDDDRVFLAYDDKPYVNPIDRHLCEFQSPSSLKISTYNIKYDERGYTINDIRNFLRKVPHQMAITPPGPLASNYVETYSTRFLTEYSVNNQPSGKYLCGALVKMEVQDLLSQQYLNGADLKDVKGFRYFFGYDGSGSRTNEIRLILIPVKQNDENFLSNDGVGEAIFLQHSWPPF